MPDQGPGPGASASGAAMPGGVFCLRASPQVHKQVYSHPQSALTPTTSYELHGPATTMRHAPICDLRFKLNIGIDRQAQPACCTLCLTPYQPCNTPLPWPCGPLSLSPCAGFSASHRVDSHCSWPRAPAPAPRPRRSLSHALGLELLLLLLVLVVPSRMPLA
jgi:hypothetical protein